jgi:hypothetical protein
MKFRPVWLLLMILLSAGGGCSRGLSEAIGQFTGAKGIPVIIDPMSPSKRDLALMQYTHFEIQPFRDNFGGRTPPELIRMLPTKFYVELAKKGIPDRRGGRTLLVRGQFIHFEDSRNAMGQVFGPFEEAIARVELVDKSTGRVLGVANCIGRSEETVNQGIEKKAEGVAEAIVDWIGVHYPKSAED